MSSTTGKKAPVMMMQELATTLQNKNYYRARELCAQIKEYEPENKDVLEFEVLITQALAPDDDSYDSSSDEDDGSGSSSPSSSSSSSSSSNSSSSSSSGGGERKVRKATAKMSLGDPSK